MKKLTLFLILSIVFQSYSQTTAYDFKIFKDQPSSARKLGIYAAGDYIFKYDYFPVGDKMRFNGEYYDGISWKALPSFDFLGLPGSVYYWNSNFYLHGAFTKVNGIEAAAGKEFRAVKWNKTSWDTVANLEMSYAFESPNYAFIESGFYCYRWLKFGVAELNKINPNLGCMRKDTICLDTNVDRNTYFRMTSNANTIFFEGNLKKINSTIVGSYFMLRDDVFQVPSLLGGGKVTPVGVDWNNDLYYLRETGSNYISKNVNGTNTSLKYNIQIADFATISPCNEQVMLLGIHQINGKTYHYYLDSGTNFWHRIYGNYNIFPSKKFGYLAWDNTNFKLYQLSKVPAGTVKGKVYVDINKNCKYDAGDLVMRNHSVIFKQNSVEIPCMTDNNGDYTQILGLGKYSISYKHLYLNRSVCNVDSITTDTNSIDTLNFALYPKETNDIAVTIVSAGNIRLDDTRNVSLIVENRGLITRNAYVTLKFNKKLVRTGGSAYQTITANSVMFRVSNIPALSKVELSNNFMASYDSFKLGDVLHYYAQADTFYSENDSLNNFDSSKMTTVYSYDPNHKNCNFEGLADPSIRRLKYFIEFQNEGNDYAQNITVADTLPAQLLMEGFRFLGASHNYTLSVSGRVLKIVFSNIYLEAKKVNEPKSKGWFSFEVDIPALPIGTEIKNKAAIYFDRNPAVITNTSVVKIAQVKLASTQNRPSSEQKLTVYPNPASSFVSIQNSSSEKEVVNIVSLNGKVVGKTEINAKSTGTFNFDSLPSGIYFIIGKQSQIKLIVTH